jgi:hypothetical protein
MIWAWLLAACSPSPPGASEPRTERSLKLVYTADVHGEIEPCG